MIYLDIGRRELGKSTLALSMARKCSKRVILDGRFMFPLGDAGAIGDLPADDSALWADLLDPTRAEIVIQPPDQLQATADRLARHVRDIIPTLAPGVTLAIVLDECGLYDLDAWDWVFRCAPRESVVVILTAHRPIDISTDIRAIADFWCVFRTTQEHDLAAIEERCGARFVARVRTLDPHQFCCHDDAHDRFTVHLDPKAWYVPLKTCPGGERPVLVGPGVPDTTRSLF